MEYSLYPLGDTAVVVRFGQTIDKTTHAKVRVFSNYLEAKALSGLVDFIPAFTTVTLFYDPVYYSKAIRPSQNQGLSPYQLVCRTIEEAIRDLDIENIAINSSKTIEIPVCYEEAYGPDLEFVAKHNKLSVDEVVKIHSAGSYLVYMLGFAPGFPYLGGMPTRIATPRKSSPRPAIPAGSVGIAGQQTGVYPIETPGGWQIIGRTPLELFQPTESNPSLIKVGDYIRFIPISSMEFKYHEEGQN